MIKIKLEFVDFGKCYVSLTEIEYCQMQAARISAMFCFWRCPSYFMSAELENILCGYRPERYEKIHEIKSKLNYWK
jgi:hypothetical protein